MKTTMQGNLIDLAEQGVFDLIVHGCNCQNTMKSGIAGEIASRYPEVAMKDSLTKKGDSAKLGSFSMCRVQSPKTLNTFIVVNMYTQEFYGRNENVVYCNYSAIKYGFEKLARLMKQHGLQDYRIGYPKIGAGLANGEWSIIEAIINQQLEGFDHTLVILNKE